MLLSRRPGTLLTALACALAAGLIGAGGVMAAAIAPARPARNVELLRGTIKPVAHSARGQASVVALARGGRVLNLRSFRIAPGPRVRVYLVRRGARGDREIGRDHRDLGALRGSSGNQRYAVPASVDLRRYSSVVFWCVPFTQSLARADLRRS